MSDNQRMIPIVCTIAREMARMMAHQASSNGGNAEGIPCPICSQPTKSIISCCLCGHFTCPSCSDDNSVCRGCRDSDDEDEGDQQQQQQEEKEKEERSDNGEDSKEQQ